jgi:hypothetical protein
MAQKKVTVSSLKEKAASHANKARQIQNKIRDLENAQYIQIGKAISDHFKKNWDGFELPHFKKTVSDILAA